MGVPSHLITEKVFDIDFSEFDITTKEGRKDAESKALTIVGRFCKRERRNKGHVWSRPKIDLDKGEAITQHSIVGDIATEAFYEAGKLYDFSSPVESELIVGMNWYETH